jgi:hypothetical protein
MQFAFLVSSFYDVTDGTEALAQEPGKELQELQQKKNFLRALYEKDLLDRKQFEQQEFHTFRIRFYKDF